MNATFFNKQPTIYTFFIFFIAACVVRGATFYYYIQHHERYCQPDTQSYTLPALALYQGRGMVYPHGAPVFWRTPGYPAFLAPFYACSTSDTLVFSSHEKAHKTALWVQLILCSLLPIFLYLLAWFLTHSLTISYALAIIGIVHPGSILASTFLLTDGPAQLFFVIFLVCLLKNIRFKPDDSERRRAYYGYLAAAALSLSIYTWMRPMGQFVALAACIVLFFSSYSWSEKIKQSLFFLFIFALSISPWFVRNYQLTGKIFFCPLFGLYFNVFNAPKIRSRIEQIPHEEAWKKQCQEAEREVYKEYQHYAMAGKKEAVVHEMICLKPALPWISNYPGYFVYDWIVEVCKTTFDLYCYQLLALYHDTFKWDPLVEYLDEKMADILYKKDLPWSIRVAAYAELIIEIILWLGIFLGLCMLVDTEFRKKFLTLWIPCGIIIGSVVIQTGGFGYARLRLPIEPLIILLGLVFWYWLYSKITTEKKNSPITLKRKHGISLRAVAK